MEDRNTHPKDAAFPMNVEYYSEENGVPSVSTKVSFGLTKREYFAAMAMQGLCADRSMTSSQSIVSLAVGCADALIAELNKEQ